MAAEPEKQIVDVDTRTCDLRLFDADGTSSKHILSNSGLMVVYRCKKKQQTYTNMTFNKSKDII